VANTELPKDLTYGDVRWPLHAALYVLPEKASQYFEGPAPLAVSMCHMKKGDMYSPPGFGGSLSFGAKEDGKYMICAMARAPSYELALGINVNGATPDTKVGLVQTELSDLGAAGRKNIMDMAKLVTKISLALAARPSLVTEGVCLRRAKTSRKKSKGELWSPNILGKSYKTSSDSDGKSGASKSLHWRRGHIRHQPFGIGRQDRKIIWVEPTIIGVES